MNAVALIACKEFSDRFRSGWVVACSVVWLGAVALTSLFGLVQIGQIGIQGYERTVVSLLNLVQYLVPLLGLLLGHDLLVGEREERTLALLVAAGLRRRSVLFGKFIGGCLVLAFPLLLGFALAGAMIALAGKTGGVPAFLELAASGLVLGLVFVAVGLLVSVLCRTRVQALVLALLAWCAAVFVFDLVAVGVVVVTHSAEAAREKEMVTGATHVNAVADLHAAFEKGDDAAARLVAQTPRDAPLWLALNPVTLFRTVNLPSQLSLAMPPLAAGLSVLCWIFAMLALANWRLCRLDL